ncbi:MAG: hypothetical protein IH841_00900 [Thaumarchaeota archaeon]|nr:hypothetical protein [Nitrososphaerota archaeon]
MKKKQKQNIVLAVIALVIIVGIIAYNYYIDQIKIKGFNFGNKILQIQNDLKKMQDDYESKIIQWTEGDLSKEELLEYSQIYISGLEGLITRYDKLTPPVPFIASVELFKLSTETQLESYGEYIKWIETQDSSFKIRSNLLLQESFEYELAALAKFKNAQLGMTP